MGKISQDTKLITNKTKYKMEIEFKTDTQLLQTAVSTCTGNLLELFAGSRCMGQEAESLGMNVFSVDWTNYENIDLSIDIENLNKEQVPFIPSHKDTKQTLN